MISARTKAALAAAKARCVVLWGKREGAASAAKWAAKADARAQDLAPVIAEMKAAGTVTLTALARGLNRRGIPTASGVGAWSAVQVKRVLARVEASA